MNGLHKTPTVKILLKAAKAVCIFMAVFTLAVFGGCGLVTPPPDNGEVTISQKSAEIRVGDVITLVAVSSENRAITWTSSNEEVATVDEGVVTGLSKGVTSITANDGKNMATCEVTVLNKDERTLVWSDEFNGTSLDASKWGYQTGTQDHYGNSTGPNYWGNGEMQYYTDGANVKVENGALQITAKRQNMGDRAFTSARITTRDKFSRTYGYFEARIKSPAIEGMWPAFWMLPHPTDTGSTDNIYGGWPNSGEIDIMEAKGRLKNVVDCTLHYGRGWQNENHMMNGKSPKLSSNIDEWHTYAVDWREDYVAWIVDGTEVHRVTSSQWWTGSSNEQTAPFDKPFYVLINLAVGGQYDGNRTPPESFSQASMYVDYVRVYE